MIAGITWACKEEAPVRYTVKSAEIDQAKALVSAYEKADWDGYMSHFADTAKIYQNSVKSITVAEALDNHKNLLSNISSYGFDPDDQFTEMILDDRGDTWVYFWGTWSGTIAANSKKIDVPVHLALQFKGNKIVKEYGYWDNYPMQVALMEAMAEKEAEE